MKRARDFPVLELRLRDSAELEMLEALREVQLARNALRQVERTLAREVESLTIRSVGELFRRPAARSLVREIASLGGDIDAEEHARADAAGRRPLPDEDCHPVREGFLLQRDQFLGRGRTGGDEDHEHCDDDLDHSHDR